MTRRVLSPLVVALLALMLFRLPVYARPSDAPSDDEVKARLGYLQTVLQSGQGRARTWLYGWLAGYSAATVVQLGLAVGKAKDIKPLNDSLSDKEKSDREFAQDMLVGGATTGLGVIGLLIDPFTPACAAGRLKALPESTPEERRAKLQEAEKLLRRCARREEDGRGLTTHLLNLGVNAAAGVVTAAVFKRPWTDGLINFGIGEAISLMNIFSQPCRAVQDLRNYEAMRLNSSGESAATAAGADWSLGLFPGGFRLAVRW